MLTKSFLTATAIALAAGLGSASAGESFATLEGVSASALTPSAMDVVRGSLVVLQVNIGAAPGGATPPGTAVQVDIVDDAFFGLSSAMSSQSIAQIIFLN